MEWGTDRTADVAETWLRARHGAVSQDRPDGVVTLSFSYDGTRMALAYRQPVDIAPGSTDTRVPSEDFVAACLARLLVRWDLGDGWGVHPLTFDVLRGLPGDLARGMLLVVLRDVYTRYLRESP